MVSKPYVKRVVLQFQSALRHMVLVRKVVATTTVDTTMNPLRTDDAFIVVVDAGGDGGGDGSDWRYERTR